MSKNGKHFQIAIDGPVAAGKSSVAKMVSKKLGLLYVDTGAMYRAVALKAMRECIQWADEESVVELMSTLDLELDKPNGKESADGRLVTVLLDEEDVSGTIRTSLIAEGASIVSTYAGVRAALVVMQQNIAEGEDVVMEGRDIGFRVLPKAQLKIYLDAKVDERVERKWEFLKKSGFGVSRKQVRADLLKRDNREMNREVDPLKPAKDAWHLDTTGKSLEDVVDEVVEKVGKVRG